MNIIVQKGFLTSGSNTRLGTIGTAVIDESNIILGHVSFDHLADVLRAKNFEVVDRQKEPPIAYILRDLFKEIEHGDQEHRDWLKSKIEDYIKTRGYE